jgi:hypothetical protein
MALHGVRHGGAHRRLTCAGCGRSSYLARNARNAFLPLTILGVGLGISLPSRLWDGYVSSLAHDGPALLRVEIWAVTTMVALMLFTLGGRLTPLYSEPTLSVRDHLRAFVADLAVTVLVLGWGYVVYTGLRGG